MKPYLVIAALVLFILWQRNRSSQQQQQRQRRPPGVLNVYSNGRGQDTQFSGYGSSSPGSGINSPQPTLNGSWGIGGGSVIGMTSPTYVNARLPWRVGQ
jgi:hypothetical protein